MGPFRMIREARRRRIVRDRPVDADLWDWVLRKHPIFRAVPDADRSRLKDLSAIFLAEKRFIPVGGAVLDDEIRVSVAAQACLPLLGLDPDWYGDWSTIYLTAREYGVLNSRIDESGVVHEFDDEFAGEAFGLGPVVLSRVDVEASGWGDGYNVVIHEMAHKLDGRDGSFDGCPPLHPGMDGALWRTSFTEAYEDLRARLESGGAPRGHRTGPGGGRDGGGMAAAGPDGADGRDGGKGKGGGKGKAGRRGGRVRIDPYAAESPDEFFAVCCEYFYEKPAVLLGEYPGVYARLAEFFRRDPAGVGRQ